LCRAPPGNRLASDPTFTIFALSQRGAERMASQRGPLTNWGGGFAA
jgi:hypothetical protein